MRIGESLSRGAGHGHSLALTARQPVALFADDGLEPFGQGHDEIPGMGGAGRGLDFLPAFFQAAVRDVVGHRVIKQHHLLADQGYLVPQAFQAHIPDVVPVHKHRSATDIVEARATG